MIWIDVTRLYQSVFDVTVFSSFCRQRGHGGVFYIVRGYVLGCINTEVGKLNVSACIHRNTLWDAVFLALFLCLTVTCYSHMLVVVEIIALIR